MNRWVRHVLNPLVAASAAILWIDAEVRASELTRCAELKLRVAGLFSVGTASLHLADCGDADRILESVPKRFSLHLDRNISGDDLSRTARELLYENLALEESQALPEELACLADAYVDGSEGQRFDVTYLPDEALTLALNGEILKRCPDRGRGAEYFQIWFGDEPFHRRMRDRLLEDARQAGRSASTGD